MIKKHTDSTYLEELAYPLRDSLYVNGFEPFYEDGTPKFWGSIKLNEGKNLWYTKTTLRYYPSKTVSKIIVWLGIISSISRIALINGRQREGHRFSLRKRRISTVEEEAPEVTVSVRPVLSS